jgi:phosphoenolpyruvate carboxykinase (GTP)
MKKIDHVDAREWAEEVPLIEEWFARVGDRLPAELAGELDKLKSGVTAAG